MVRRNTKLILGSEPLCFPRGSAGKNLPVTQETRVQFLGWEDPRRRAWQPAPVFCLENPMDRGA